MPLPTAPSGLIALGHILTLVRHTANRSGGFRVRGPDTGWEYRVASPNACLWVAEPDLPRFRAHADFDVCDDTRANEPLDPLEPLRAELTALRAALEERDSDRPGAATVAPRGRPRAVSQSSLVEMNHLNRHIISTWTYHELAAELLEDPPSKRPPDLVRKRLERFRKQSPDVASEGGCPRCANGDVGRPPPKAFDPTK